MNTVRSKWNTYAREVIPPDAPGTQLIESRRAFYAGAAALFFLLNEAAVDGEPDSAGAAKLEVLNQELQAFARGELESGHGLPKEGDEPKNRMQRFDATLTAEEKAAPTFLEWSDTTLARAVRTAAQDLNDPNGVVAMHLQASLMQLAKLMRYSNAAEMKNDITTTDGFRLKTELKLTKEA